MRKMREAIDAAPGQERSRAPASNAFLDFVGDLLGMRLGAREAS